LISFSVAAINIVIGVVLGSISGYYGGTVDLVMERVSEILAGLPFLAILTLLLLRFGNSPFVVVLAFTMTGWLGISALTRSQFYRYKNREYVLAARTLGAGDRRIMYRHIFPSAVGTIITRVILYIPGVIFTESTFSFLGIINYGDIISVGRLMSNGQLVMKSSFYQLLFPAIFISLLMLSFNLFGNGLRDAFNPSLRGVEE
jgi:oligopeptide transport system permease protein